ncbi:hypothetical protein C8Q76DRAFT_629863 [Earliella scabrosa]|nr:hypothetical protein C8Q76DRAFT_629863 [Earliella scabrosa]
MIGQPCPECHEWRALYRCTECHQNPVFCAPCVVRAHQRLPLHRVERWSGTHFEHIPLVELGLTVHLGHRGQPCPYLRKSTKSSPLTVVHTTGVHQARVLYCRCPDTQEPPLQLWHSGWWPGSFIRPQTAFTYPVLRFYDRLTLQAKTSALDFWGTLRRLTNQAFPSAVKV